MVGINHNLHSRTVIRFEKAITKNIGPFYTILNNSETQNPRLEHRKTDSMIAKDVLKEDNDYSSRL